LAIKTYTGPRAPRVYDGSETINGWIRTIAERETYPGVRRRNQIAMDGNPVQLYFYQELKRGRRCSCWEKNGNPFSGCRTCFGTGMVGGYQKYGTYQFLIDPTLPEVESSGLEIKTGVEGPEAWVLGDEYQTGYLKALINLQGNWGPVDHLSLFHWAPEGGAVKWEVRPFFGSGGFLVLTQTNLERLTNKPQLLEIKVTLERPGLEAQSPVVVNGFLRIKRTPDAQLIIKGNRPKINTAIALEELGALDEWSTATHWIDHTLPLVTSKDWFYNIEEETRWKVVEASALDPQGYLLSWELPCMKLQKDSPIYQYPV